MKIVFTNLESVDISLDNSDFSKIYQKIYKHLSKVPIPFQEWDNPYYLDQFSYSDLVDKLLHFSSKLSLSIDQKKCLAQDQFYFNEIHKIYETNWDGNPLWLDFHEHIHLCENFFSTTKNILSIDYREKAGLLERPFDLKWLNDATTNIQAGSVFVEWSELGKTPYHYWQNQEPSDIVRMCELSKPWLKLKPKIIVALEDIDRLAAKRKFESEFEKWWQKYQKDWCQHWNIPSWSLRDMFSVKVFGQVADVESIKTYLKAGEIPTRVLIN
jgi:hypothetical protein